MLSTDRTVTHDEVYRQWMGPCLAAVLTHAEGCGSMTQQQRKELFSDAIDITNEFVNIAVQKWLNRK